jgi:formylglycine-generating enzyme required for sulfatase activity
MGALESGGIVFSSLATSGSKYYTIPGRGNNPVNFVTWYDAIRFANWMHNGQGNGDTETGAYTLGQSDSIFGTPRNGSVIVRIPGAKWFLPNEDEWYKAAYHKNDGVTGNYWDYPTSTDELPYSDQPPGSDSPDPSNTVNIYKNDAIFDNGYDDGYAVLGATSFPQDNPLTDVGAYTLALGPYGTYDQGGNIFEWNEILFNSNRRGLRGGSWANTDSSILHASTRISFDGPYIEAAAIGFRVATIPEPAGITLCLAPLTALSLSRTRWSRRPSCF